MTHDGTAARGTSLDFFTTGALPAPELDEAGAPAIAAEHFDLRVRARSLGSQQDSNFLLTTADGDHAVVGVLKGSNGTFGPADIAAQDAAADHLDRRVEGLRVATTLPSAGARTLTLPSGTDAVARVLSYLPGGSLSGSGHLAPHTVAALGGLAGRVVAALADFTHPALERVLQWDLRHADRVVEALAPCVADPDLCARVQEVTRTEWARVQGVAMQLPRQAIHGDLTDDNVVCADGNGPRLPDGVIDLGDLTESWTVGELAIAVSSLLHHDGASPAAVLPAVAAFHAVRPLSDAEIEALWPLVVLRGAVLVVSGHQQVTLDAANYYVAANMVREQRIFDVASSLPSTVMTALLRARLGLTVSPAQLPADAGRLAEPPGTGERLEVLDLSSTADALDGGVWLNPDIEDRLAAEALDGGATVVVTRFGEPRLTRAAPLSASPPDNVATGLDAWWDHEVTLRAPWDGTAEDGGRRLRGEGGELRIDITAAVLRAQDGTAVRRGDALVTVPSRTRTRITVRVTGAGRPRTCRAS